MFLRAIANEGGIFKVLFSMKQVPGSFTGEALCEELVKEILNIRPVKNNATVTIRGAGALSEFQGFMSEKPTQKYKQMHFELQNAASVADFDKIMNIKNEMELLVENYPNLKSIYLDTIQMFFCIFERDRTRNCSFRSRSQDHPHNNMRRWLHHKSERCKPINRDTWNQFCIV